MTNDKPHPNDDDTVFATADPITVDRNPDDGYFDAIAETNRLRDEIINAPAPGSDPDSRKRLGKALAAAGEDVPSHLRGNETDDTDNDRPRETDEEPTAKTDAAQKRAAAGTRTTTPTGRSATPKA